MQHKVNILFIEDHNDYREYISFFFKRKKLLVNPVFAKDGPEAIEYLKASEESNTFPDLICVDLYLPQMTGFDFGTQYQNHFAEKYPETLLFLTTHLDLDNFMEIISDKSTLSPFYKEVIFKPLSSHHLDDMLIPIIQKKLKLVS